MAEETDQEAGTGQHEPIDIREEPQARRDWIATYAYFLAEARGFTPEYVLDDWLQAELAYTERGLAKGESD